MNRKTKAVLNAAEILGGGALIKRQFDKGNLTGRELVYHSTNKGNEDSIKEKGILASKASDKNNLTHKALSEYITDDDMKGLTYVGRNKIPASAITITSANYDSHDKASRNYKNIKNALKDRTTLKLKIPAWKMKIVDNPELMGTKNSKEFYPIVKKRLSTPIGESIENYEEKPDNAISRIGYGTASKAMHYTLGRKGTHVIQGDLPAKYVKGSKHYKRADKDEVEEYIKNNPKRFAKGVVGAGIGAGLIANGVRNGIKIVKKAGDDMSEYYKECIEKEASVRHALKSGGKALAGIALIKGSSDMLLGKKTVYHGTSKDNWDSIKEKGLMSSKGGKHGVSANVNKGFKDESKNKIHVTSTKPVATYHAVFGSRPEEFPVTRLRVDLNRRKDNILKRYGSVANMPERTKQTYKKLDREQKELYPLSQKEYKRGHFLEPGKNGKVVKAKIDYDKFKNMEIDDKLPLNRYLEKKSDGKVSKMLQKNIAARGAVDITPEEIKDSDVDIEDRVKHTRKALPSYIKNNPLRFGAGVVGTGMGAKLIRDSLRRG